MADIETLSNEIDALLERYLDLLNTYTTLRAQLNSTQASFHQNLSRANFTSPNNERYGEASYPKYMEATRLTAITATSKDPTSPNTPTTNFSVEVSEETKIKKDPIRFFGLLTPPSLKAAQGDAVKVVGELVPKLVSLDIEMRGLEIEIRRRRKFRVKAEERIGKEGVGIEVKEGLVV